MYILWTLAKLCLLMASNFGFWEAARRKWNINVYLLPALTVGAQFCVMFTAGLLNYLGEAAELMYFGGLFLLLWQLYREKGRFWKLVTPYLNWGYGLFLLGMAAALIALRGRTLSGIDNFTHWAVVVKNLLLYDRFPTFAQDAVTFTSYPLGSAASIYYFCRHVSDGEWAFMLGQAYMMLCMLLPLFSCGKEKALPGAAVIAVMGNFLLCCNIPITELLVDTLLPLTAGAMLVSVARGCREEGNCVYRYSLPMLVLTLNVKNSGLFFCAAGLLLMWCLLRKQGKRLKPLLVTVLVLLAVYSLWKRHCDYVFVNSQMSQHAVSLEYFKMRLGERTLAEMGQILKGVVRYVWSRKPLIYLAAWLGAALVCARFSGNRKCCEMLAAVCLVLYAAWMVSLAGMYLFSMRVQEALELLSIERYCRSMDILLYYLLTAFCLNCLPGEIRKGWLWGALLTALALLTWVGGGAAVITAPPQGDTTLRDQVEELVAEYGVEKGYSYLICDRVAKGYSMFALRYCMNTSRVEQVAITDPAQMEIEKDYDYVFLLDTENPILQEWVMETYPDQAGRAVIQCIK